MAWRAGTDCTTDGAPGRPRTDLPAPDAAASGPAADPASDAHPPPSGDGPADAREAHARPVTAPVGSRPGVHRALRLVLAWGLVVPTALWLVVRVTSVGRGTTVETFIVFTPYVALASIAVLAITAALRVRPAALAAAACSAGYALVVTPLFVAAGPPSPAPTGPGLRVMSSNVQFGWADAATVVRLVEEGDIDVLGVQELTPAFHHRLVAEGLEDLLPHGVVDARDGASGTGLYSRFPVERAASDHPGTDIPGEHAHPTGLVEVPGAPPVQVTVVHPVPPVAPGSVDAWQETLAALPRPDPGGTVHLLVGDFNATVDQPTLRDLLDDGYTDAALARGDGWQPTWRRSRFGPALTIDHVLVDGATAVERVSVHDVPGSDHRALVAAVRLPEV